MQQNKFNLNLILILIRNISSMNVTNSIPILKYLQIHLHFKTNPTQFN